jgi:glycosyltransferase involved in cell wall biosynthesis
MTSPRLKLNSARDLSCSFSHDMISILFDDIIFALQRFGGASVYWREVTSRIAMDHLFQVRRVGPARWRRFLPQPCNKGLFHSSHFRLGFGPGIRTVSTVHDLHYELGLMGLGVGARANRLERRASYFTADALVCISESTKRDLLSVYPALERRCPIHVIHHGYSRPSAPLPVVEAAPAVRPYALFVGQRGGYKNFDTALRGFHASLAWRDGLRLVCTGGPRQSHEADLVRSLGLEDRVVFKGRVGDHDMPALYEAAYCLLYPSAYEGFGLPPLEAMANGCPVIAARASSIPEVTGDDAILVANGDVAAIARGLISLQDNAFRADLIDRGRRRAEAFTWDRSAQSHARLYRAMAGKQGS